jgi:anti-sigma regulatory factor (Ser/Thr protein kinase)
MQADHRDAAHERASASGNEAPGVAALRATCRRQAWAIETMSRVLRDLRTGLRALKAENAELRDVSDRRRRADDARTAVGEGVWAEACVPLDVRAPGAARIVVAQVLGERVAAPVLERAKLVMSELVSNSVRHSGVAAGAGVIFRVRLVAGGFWLEVEDPGRDGIVAQHAATPDANGGFGLHIVQALSERWGIERALQGGTRVWAQLSDTAPAADPDWHQGDEQARAQATAAGAPRAPATQRHQRQRTPLSGRSSAVHVIPEPRTATWRVYVDADAEAVSEHTSETEAESAARAQLRTRGTSSIVIHDRYHRTRTATPQLTRPDTRTSTRTPAKPAHRITPARTH